jgi:hypothetical protein
MALSGGESVGRNSPTSSHRGGILIGMFEGKVIGQCMKRHRHQEFIRFLNVIDARVPANKTVHAIIDNYAGHKHPKVLEWLARHPRLAARVTGPRTPEGLERSRRANWKHGYYSRRRSIAACVISDQRPGRANRIYNFGS